MSVSVALTRAFVLALLLALCGAHELCLSTDGPTNAQNTFCSAYNAHTCCSADTDTAIAALHSQLAINDAACNATLAELLCAQCDPWGAHIFGIELQLGRSGTPVPYLCPAYAEQVYNACAAVPMNWPADSSPFGGAVIGDTYANETAFCSQYCAPPILGSFCYDGTPYIPTSANVAHDGQVCFSYWGSSSNSAGQNAIWMQDVGDGTILVVFKNGEIRRRNKTSGEDLGNFMTVSNVYDNGEAGLLSIALHPSFLANGRWFAYYSQTVDAHPVACAQDTVVHNCGKYIACNNGKCDGNHISVIAEFQSVNGTQGLADSGRELLYVVQPFGNHNGGQLLFDSEGFLRIALGDGGGGYDTNNRSQDLETFFGKILRIDVDSAAAPGKAYAIPASNPGISAVWPEIYAYGLRNPWRSSFDAADPTRYFVADVGQDTREEVDIVVKGGNYGWRKYEGFIVNPLYPNDPDIPNAIKPIMDYDHTQGTSVIGGYVYRGRRDASLLGRYIFGDLSSGLLLGSDSGNDTWSWSRPAYVCGGDCPSSSIGLIWSFYEDADRDVYVIGTGGIFRLSERSTCNLVVGNSTAVPDTNVTAPPAATSAAPAPTPASTASGAPPPSPTTPAVASPQPSAPAPATSTPVDTQSSDALALLANAVLCFTLALGVDQLIFE